MNRVGPDDERPPRIVVCGSANDPRAAAWAARLGLELTARPDPADHDLALSVEHGRLSIGPVGATAPGPIAVDFADDTAARRSRGTSGNRPLIARALGLDRGVREIVDATAGLGRDAFTLAACGARVTMVERHPVLAALLDDGLTRARDVGVDASDRLELVHADAVAFLEQVATPPDAVFIDPMFPDRGKSALPGRDLQLLRALLGHGGDEVARLLELARAVVRRRVVVKRPARAPAVGGRADASYAGARVRYDVYTPRA